MSKRAINFSAGPATLPVQVLEEARRDLVDYQGSGMSVMEMSHRSPEYDAIHRGTSDVIRTLMRVPESHAILFLQGGASQQFSMVPMNLMHPGRRADYVVTGVWSKKAVKEAQREGAVRVAATTEDESFSRIPAASELDLDSGADYVHITTNNTIAGSQWWTTPDTGSVPLVADMSSDIMSHPVPTERFGLIYAGAQKNLGPAGVTIVIADKELLERAPSTLPTMLQYRTFAEKDSLFNTPPCWSIYVVGLVCRWVASQGGLVAMERSNRAKAGLIYDLFDTGDFYRGTVASESRSIMNIPFRLPNEELEKRFVAESKAAGMTNLKGHRSVGGIRASVYNAMPRSGVEALVDFMREFERAHG